MFSEAERKREGDGDIEQEEASALLKSDSESSENAGTELCTQCHAKAVFRMKISMKFINIWQYLK